jgi:NhaP-type Na+/H+ or K+/H+ antiporter
MANSAILAVSALLVFAYLLDIFGRRYKLPAVVLLVVTGMVGRQVLDRLGFHLDWVNPLVPVIGTVGLILIVLEGALDLSLRRDRAAMIGRAVAAAFLGFALCVGAFTLVFNLWLGLPAASAALAALPFAVISSAVAIPSAAGLGEHTREFVIYESAVSDIIGVLVFYAWLESHGALPAFAGNLFGGGALSLVAAAVAAVGLLYLINRIEGHVRFLPLLAGLVLLYAIGKALHLSPLVLVLVCGLLLNNPHLLDRAPPLKALLADGYDDTLAEFKGLVAELTFAVKSFFFLMLGYWTDVSHMAGWQAWAVAAAIIVVIYPSRLAVLGALGQPDARRLVWLAPRGLITVLLFLTAYETGTLGSFPFGAVMLVVLATAAATGLAHRGPAADASAPTPDEDRELERVPE